MGNTFKGGRDQPHRKTVITVGTSKNYVPELSVQCFESRHADCPGVGWGPLVGKVTCECKCHGKTVTQKDKNKSD